MAEEEGDISNLEEGDLQGVASEGEEDQEGDFMVAEVEVVSRSSDIVRDSLCFFDYLPT